LRIDAIALLKPAFNGRENAVKENFTLAGTG
jgi:hypothetical protein